MKKYTFTFTTAEADQLLSYLEHRDDGPQPGWYYGRKALFERRHEAIRDKLETRRSPATGEKS